MNADDRVKGWVLAAAVAVHLLLLRFSSPIILGAFLLLAAGAVLRGRQIFAPAWLERSVLVAGTLAAFWLRAGSVVFFGELAGLLAATQLLRPVTPSRGLRVIFCLLAMVAAAALRPFPSVNALFIVLDVAVLVILTEHLHRPPEAAIPFLVALTRSLRVVAPVSLIVILVFTLFPSLSLQTVPAITAFVGSDVLDPRRMGELVQSRRVAMVARFDADSPVPGVEDLYWRGQVLENNEGLRWSRETARGNVAASLAADPPRGGETVWRYRQDVPSSRGGILAVLDRVWTVDARRDGQEIAVLDIGAGALSAVGSGELRLAVASVADTAADPPEAGVAGGALGLPRDIADNATLQKTVRKILLPGQTTAENLDALARFFREGGFVYSLRPGRIPNLAKFLGGVRRGYCEHYAAAAANMLRIGGLPARVVTGYRGGEWNPWRRTITVRDADAHAWVEVWDAPAGRWVRFDPTSHVAPDLTERMERNLDSSRWPWYRTAAAYVTSLFAAATERLTLWWDKALALEIWESLQPVFLTALVLILAAWLARRVIHRRLDAARNYGAAVLAELETAAARAGRGRRPGETPLGWLRRLEDGAPAAEGAAVRAVAEAFEPFVYAPGGATTDRAAALRTAARTLKRLWRRARIGLSASGAPGKMPVPT
jgi:hypothetical protein